ncbi:Putative hydroxypyruvate isomerase YgbM [Jannaschia seosinensis]|uniref:Putative hydroxypyruvate isomerase YgbM n=1 Tax=Jannaschia seosinensis TaxID=313367 RepID=A0A0M7B7L0_9RHOB|nr:TIM barrel protein [Jannaschia seosinensis]CUH24314.1 Putative hydroxypyruvate isomerase YgbM [Jannaschia seosinensis]
MRYAANLGFLFTDLALPDAVRAAAQAGFDAVECHFPYETPVADLRAALDETGLRMLALNTWPGDRDAGEFGLCALPGRQDDARREIARAVDYAAAAGMDAVHVMAGRTDGGEAADACFCANLRFACDLAAARNLRILIEPINTRDVPGYHLSGTDHAERVLDAVQHDALGLMFDCYHMQIMQGDLARTLRRLMPRIGHVQIAAVPDRGEPDAGEVNYSWLMRELAEMGYGGHVGAEYRPRAGAGSTAAGLSWLSAFRDG